MAVSAPSRATVRPADALRTALQALARESRRHHAEPNTAFTVPVSWVSAVRGVSSPCRIDVGLDGLVHERLVLLDAGELRTDLPLRLAACGVRSVVIESGATDAEIERVARLMHDATRVEEILPSLWEADFEQVRVILGDPVVEDALLPPMPDGLLAGVRSLLDDLERDVPAAELLAAAPMADLVLTAGRAETRALGLSDGLREELSALTTGADVEMADAPGALVAALLAAVSPEVVRRLGAALFEHALRRVELRTSPSRPLHALLDLLDPETTRDVPFRDELAAAAALAAVSSATALGRLAVSGGERRLHGFFFSLAAIVPRPSDQAIVVERLPPWALQAFADGVAAAHPQDPMEALREAQSLGGGRLLLALGLVARVTDGLAIDMVLPLTAHTDPTVREAALYALRQHKTQRVRERVHALLQDPTEGVRLEALRHAVAWRDTEVVPVIERFLQDPQLARRSEQEVRALCIAFGRIARADAESLLTAWALGQRPAAHPAQARFALHGLRSSATGSARASLVRISQEVPRLRDEAVAMLREGA